MKWEYAHMCLKLTGPSDLHWAMHVYPTVELAGTEPWAGIWHARSEAYWYRIVASRE